MVGFDEVFYGELPVRLDFELQRCGKSQGGEIIVGQTIHNRLDVIRQIARPAEVMCDLGRELRDVLAMESLQGLCDAQPATLLIDHLST